MLLKNVLPLMLVACVVAASLFNPALATEPKALPADGPLTQAQGELLDLAMAAASKIPYQPHIKDRCRMQEKVAKAAMELDQATRASAFMKKIDNWRQGYVTAEFACYLARRGHTDNGENLLKIARAYSLLASQDWHRERVEFSITKARVLLGDKEAGAKFSARLTSDMHKGQILETHVEKMSDEDLESIKKQLDFYLDSERYEPILNAARGYIALYERLYADKETRDKIEQKLRDAYSSMGPPEHIELFMALGEAALANNDKSKALGFVEEVWAYVSKGRYPEGRHVEFEYVGRVTDLRSRAGDTRTARGHLDDATAKAKKQIEDDYMLNYLRADALRPLAEAYQTMGESDIALGLYELAIEQGMVNPNSLQRAEDLTRTCLSMALHGVEPTDRLLARAKNILDEGLGDPW